MSQQEKDEAREAQLAAFVDHVVRLVEMRQTQSANSADVHIERKLAIASIRGAFKLYD